MNKKSMIASVWFWMLLGVVVVDSSFAQEKMPEISGLTPKGKRVMPEIPDFTKGGKKNDRHDWNLGPTGARGWMWGMRLRTDYARQILITKVDDGSPADGILAVDDVILGINGKKFDSDARIAFGKAITEAEKVRNGGRLKLIRWRKGKIENITLRLKVMGTYGPTAPMDCRKSQRILDNACKYIETNGIGRGITGHVNALGLLASGSAKYLLMVRDYAHKIKVKDAYSMSSWNMSYMNIFLSEYYLLTRDKAVLPKIREMALYLANGQSRVGTWGHNNAGPDGILRGYGAMCQPTLSCAVSLVLNQKCGIDEPVVEQAIRKAEIFFLHFVDKGNIPYGDHSPREVHDSNGRNSLAVILFDLLDNPDAYWFYARMTVASYGEREEGHTGNYWSFLWGPLGAMRAGPEAAAAFTKELEWFFELERRWDGGFTYQGGANMSGAEHTTPGWDTTGARILMYAMSQQKLHITGKGLKVEKALSGKELEDTLLAGRDYNTWFREGYINTDTYDVLSSDELLKRLNTWSPPMRIRAAKALAKKPDDCFDSLKKMLESKDRDTLLGGIYGLEYQKKKAEPATDDLVELLTHEDVWVRFRAGCALCSIGKAAKDKAVPVMLKMATRTFPDDPREMNQRYLSYVLWGGGVNGAPHGLLKLDMNGVHQELLVPAIKKMIRNEDGLTRSFVSRAIRMMSFEELKPLWPDLVWGLKNPAPSGIMFNADIRETCMNVLVKYRFEEAIPYIAEYARTMKQHGSQERIYRVMDTLKSYGAAAKSALPDLYKTRKYYQENLGPGKPLEFPRWALEKFMKGLNEGIKAIEDATKTPKDLRTIEDYIEKDALGHVQQADQARPKKQGAKNSVKVFILAGQSNMEGQGVVSMDHPKYYNGGKGNLLWSMKHSTSAEKMKHLKNEQGQWVVRDDVQISFKAGGKVRKGELTIGYTGYGGSSHIGPELQFGHVIGDYFDEPVLLIKTAWGGKSLYVDFRPPSSGGKVGPFYTKMIEEVRAALTELKGQEYELAGFVWMQGWNDMCTKPAIPEYAQNLINLARDIRKEFNVPNLPFIVGELGNGGPVKGPGGMSDLRKAQQDGTRQINNTAFVKTTGFAHPKELSPNVGHGHHWFGNAESYFLIGDALAKAAIELIEKMGIYPTQN